MSWAVCSKESSSSTSPKAKKRTVLKLRLEKYGRQYDGTDDSGFKRNAGVVVVVVVFVLCCFSFCCCYLFLNDAEYNGGFDRNAERTSSDAAAR